MVHPCSHFRRTLSFEDYGDGDTESDSCAAMCRRLCQKFGLESDSSMAESVLQHFRSVFEPPKKKRKREDQQKPTSRRRKPTTVTFDKFVDGRIQATDAS